jgi:hypothetical protein
MTVLASQEPPLLQRFAATSRSAGGANSTHMGAAARAFIRQNTRSHRILARLAWPCTIFLVIKNSFIETDKNPHEKCGRTA